MLRSILRTAGILTLPLLLGASLTTASAQTWVPTATQAITISNIPTAIDAGPLNPQTNISVVVGLKTQNVSALQQLVKAQNTPGNAAYQTTITPAQFLSTYAPTSSQVQAVTSYLQSFGFTILVDDCKITSEKFCRGGHNSLLPFVLYLFMNPHPKPAEKRELVVAVYVALMSGIFAGAEARMGAFARKECVKGKPFPLENLCRLVAQYYGITSLETLLTRHLDLTLNIAHGGSLLITTPKISNAITSSLAQPLRQRAFPKSGQITTPIFIFCATR